MKLQRSNEQGSLISLFSGKYLFQMLGNAVKERFLSALGYCSSCSEVLSRWLEIY